eukprot:GEMP01027774.1.p1 GENE.GEMP01027774.1~~GEMP01027774.1.p1  ORF type:complete len:332 (+),score=28.98 GEMP01027774.1:135-1130(+)
MNKKTSCYHNRSIVVIFIDKKRTGMDDGLDEGHDRLLQRSCLILGTSLLFPFYCFVTAVDFWNSQFPESWDFMFLVGVCHNVPNFLLLIFQIVYLRQVLTCDIRIIVSIGIYFACLLCVPIFIIAKLSAGTMFTVCLIVLCFVGGAASILQGTLFSVIAQLGPRYVRMLFVGNAGAGVVTGILRVLTKFALEKHHEAQALLFFAVAALFTAFCVFTYLYASRRIARLLDIVKRDPRGPPRNELTETSSSLRATLSTILPDLWMALLGVFFSFCLTLNLFPGQTGKIKAILVIKRQSKQPGKRYMRLYYAYRYLCPSSTTSDSGLRGFRPAP